MTVKELKKQLKNISEDTKLLAYQPDASSYVELNKEPVEETINLCPNCSVYCERRFIDGICH